MGAPITAYNRISNKPITIHSNIYEPDYVVVVDADEFPAEEVEKLKIGDKVFLQDGYGRAFPVTVTALEADKITFDGNHEMAGKDLNFKIELVDILD